MTERATSRFALPLWRRWLSVVFLLGFAVTSALAGSTFVWCFSLARAKAACCCHVPAQGQGEDAFAADDASPALDRAPCCETRQFDAAGPSEAPRDPLPAVAAAPPLALPPALPGVPAPVALETPVVAARPLPKASRAPPLIPIYKRDVRFLC